MTPGARVAAAIAILDRVAAGEPAEKALTGWARRARYAGSKDRAAVRDHVFDVIRRWRSTASDGGANTGRGRMIGLLRQQGIDLGTVFTGDGHAPAPLSVDENAQPEPSDAAARDVPDWLWPLIETDLGPAAAEYCAVLRDRAPVFLRVNLARTTRDAAATTLRDGGIETVPGTRSPTALRVTDGARKIAQSAGFQSGMVELQDASSQAIVDALGLSAGSTVLDFCAGGGGKALAMAARTGAPVAAWDAARQRMRDIPARARRAGAVIRVLDQPEGRYDLVLCDVPCSGSGTWRRAPEGKWTLTQDMLTALGRTQSDILARAAQHVGQNGVLAYATCSVLSQENNAPIDRFLSETPGWDRGEMRFFLPDEHGDGLFLQLLHRTHP